MKTKIKYVLVREHNFKKVVNINFAESFEMTKNKDKERIGVIKFYDERIIDNAIKKVIDYRFKKILELMASLEESDEDPSDGLIFCLDEAAKFKREMINKYDKFLKKTQIEFINKKIELIEKEVKNKLVVYRLMNSPILRGLDNEDEYDDDYEEEIHRSR